MPEQPELKRCLCGSVRRTEYVRARQGWRVRCPGCGVIHAVLHATEDQAIQAANRRVAHPTCATCGHWVSGHAFTNAPKRVCDLMGTWTGGAWYCPSHTALEESR